MSAASRLPCILTNMHPAFRANPSHPVLSLLEGEDPSSALVMIQRDQKLNNASSDISTQRFISFNVIHPSLSICTKLIENLNSDSASCHRTEQEAKNYFQQGAQHRVLPASHPSTLFHSYTHIHTIYLCHTSMLHSLFSSVCIQQLFNTLCREYPHAFNKADICLLFIS